jgi:hypothetical protein
MKRLGGASSEVQPSEAAPRATAEPRLDAAWKSIKSPVGAHDEPGKGSFTMKQRPNGKSPLDGPDAG